MKSDESSRELFEFEIRLYSFLTELGFQQKRNGDEVAFFSNKLVLQIRMQRFGEPASMRVFDAVSMKEIPSPHTALQFFLNDYSSELTKAREAVSQPNDLRSAIAANIELLKRNSWILQDISWASNPQFLYAITQVNTWFLQAKTPLPSSDEVIEKLRSYRENG